MPPFFLPESSRSLNGLKLFEFDIRSSPVEGSPAQTVVPPLLTGSVQERGCALCLIRVCCSAHASLGTSGQNHGQDPESLLVGL